MKIQISNYKILQYNEWVNRGNQDPSLDFLIHRNLYYQFQKDNDEVFKTAIEFHQEIIKSHFQLDKEGKIIQHQLFKDEIVKAKYFWQKDKVRQVPNGQQPVLLAGKTMELFQKVMDAFLGEIVEVNLKPRVYHRFPVIIS